jgi:hypothetical protein
MIIRYCKGKEMRDLLPDLDIILWHGRHGEVDTRFIPPNAIWIDHRFKDEEDFLLKLFRYHTNPWYADWPYKKLRTYLNKVLTRKGEPPEFVVRTLDRGNIREHNRRLKTEDRLPESIIAYIERSNLRIRFVRGDIVRQWYDVEFIAGGHHRVYRKYIAKGDVYIDVKLDPHEYQPVILHEVDEHRSMGRGLKYAEAHERATILEMRMRTQRFLTQESRTLTVRTPTTPKPLGLEPYVRTLASSAPACLKIVARYHGHDIEEAYLAALCEEHPGFGIDHTPFASAAKRLGATVFRKAGGTMRELRHFVQRLREPVIVGLWFGPERGQQEVLADPRKDGGRYCIVRHITSERVHLLDPSVKGGKRSMPIPEFLARWYDMDEEAAVVKRWYMTMNFEGKTFDIAGGVND